MDEGSADPLIPFTDHFFEFCPDGWHEVVGVDGGFLGHACEVFDGFDGYDADDEKGEDGEGEPSDS